MWKQKIGISIGNQYAIPTEEVIDLLAAIGFDAISPEWEESADLAGIAAAAHRNHLTLQSLHAPYSRAADMWSEDDAVSAPAKADLLHALEDCRRFQIPVLVVHVWIGFEYTFRTTRQGFQNFEEIVERAKEYGVKIAFENTEGEEYLFALMEYFKGNDTVGFCWDSGHEMCYNHSRDLLKKLGDRLLMTHLNDNLGIRNFDGTTFWTDDLHLLPYDGIANWDDNIKRLKRSQKLDILNFELNIHSKPNRHENDCYAQMDLVSYFTEAYKRACRIAYRYSGAVLHSYPAK